MQAILTKYHGPTNFKGSRISAQADSCRIYLPYDHALNIEENHRAAAHAYADKLGWLSGTPDKPTRQRFELLSGTIHTGAFVHVLHRLPDAEVAAA
jgi:hypothetical protein